MSEKVVKTKRSNSAKLKGMLENKLKIPGPKFDRSNSVGSQREVAEDISEDCDTPDILPILRRSTVSSTSQSNGPKDPRLVSSEGLIKYEDMLRTLKCGHCAQTTCPPVVQCRKGHMYCKSCKLDNKIIQCSTCKQTFVDAPNQALDQLIRLIAIPCKFGVRGCGEFVFLDSRLQHETLCKFRPVNCQNQKHGCSAIFSVKDMCWHHKMCEYANYPHPNVLPSMPTRKKAAVAAKPLATPQPDVTSDTPSSPAAVNGQAAQPAADQPLPSTTAGNGDAAEKPSVQVQTEIKLFPGILSKN